MDTPPNVLGMTQTNGFRVRLTRVDNSGDDRIFVESSWLVKTVFETRHEANVYALGAIKFPHIINVEVIDA